MNHDYHWFTQQSIKRKVFHPLPRVSTCKDGEIAITHDSNIPDIGNFDRTGIRIDRNRIVIYYGDKIGVLECLHGGFCKYALRKYHDPIVMNSGIGFVMNHSLERLLCLPVEAVLIPTAELRPGMVAAMHGH